MGDHFELLVDRLLTESTLEAAIESKKQQLQLGIPSASADMMNGFSSHRMDADSGSSPRKLVLCRICHDEEGDSMEIPCSCCGTLKEARNVSRFASDKENELPQLQPQPQLHLIHIQ